MCCFSQAIQRFIALGDRSGTNLDQLLKAYNCNRTQIYRLREKHITHTKTAQLAAGSTTYGITLTE